MKQIKHNGRIRGFSLPEAILVSVILAVLIAVFLPTFRLPRTNSKRIGCVNNLKQIGLAFNLWAGDNNDRPPSQVSVTNGGTMELVGSGIAYVHFLVMSNELSTPKILVCHADSNRGAATNWTSLRNTSLSYFAGLDSYPTNLNTFLSGDDNFTVNGIRPRSGLLKTRTNSTVAWLPTRHVNAGNLCFADGSVQQIHNARLQQALAQTGVATNRLLMP